MRTYRPSKISPGAGNKEYDSATGGLVKQYLVLTELLVATVEEIATTAGILDLPIQSIVRRPHTDSRTKARIFGSGMLPLRCK